MLLIKLPINQIIKGKKKVVEFKIDSSDKNKLALLSGSSSKWTVLIAKGLPADTKPKIIQIKKKEVKFEQKKETKIEPKKEIKIEPKREEIKVEPKFEPKKFEPKKEEKVEPKFEPKTNNFNNFKKEEVKEKVEPKFEPKKFEVKKEEPKTNNNVTKNELPKTNKGPPPLPKKVPDKPKYKVIYAYEAQGNDELTIVEGDILYVHEKDESGWWDGEFVSGKKGRGLIPGNYLVEL